MMKKEVIILGTGCFTKKYLSKIENFFDIKAFCDNDVKKQGVLFHEKYMIYSVEEAVKNFHNLDFLISVNTRNCYEIVFSQLKKLGISVMHVNDALLEVCRDLSETFYLSEEGSVETKHIQGDEKNIFVLTAPMHSNLGDQAQSMCTEQLLGKRFSGKLFIYDQDTVMRNYFELLYIIKQNLKSDDMIFLHSGYRLTNLYMDSVYAVEMMLELFHDRKIVFLPQTIHFTDDKVSSSLSNKVGENITIMCRDKNSLEIAEQIFQKSRNILCPDLVTSLIGKRKYKNKREGILLCLRSSFDGESFLNDSETEKFIKDLMMYDKVTFTDTTIKEDWKKIAKNREYYVWNEIERYSCYKILITNRFHGIVFGLASNTPVIALPTRDHKITAAVSWFNEVGYKDVYLCKNKDDVFAKVSKLLDNNIVSDNTDYFYENYFKNFEPWNI